MASKWLTPILVAVVAAISVWLLAEQAPEKPRLTALRSNVPDAFMKDITTTIMNKHGKPRHELHANYMAHFSFDNHSEFTKPQFTFYQPDESQWVMTAENGSSDDGAEQIILHGEVTMTSRQSDANELPLRVITSELLIRPNDAYAETDELITITKGEHSLQAKGVRAYFNDRRVELLSRVRGVYAL
jgi:lipopolysaccharide export system protein LptC